MSKILGPLFVNDKRKKDETTVTASNPRDSTEHQDSDESTPSELQDPEDYFEFFGYSETSPSKSQDPVDPFGEFGSADSVPPESQDPDDPFGKQINDSGASTETHNESCTHKTHKPSIRETYKDAIYTDQSGTEKIDRIKFVEIYINDNSITIAHDTSNDAQLIYIFSNGKYTYFSDVDVKRDITQTILDIDPYLFSVSEVNDILARIKLQAPKISIDDFDSNEYIINFKNGLVDIRTGTLMPHSPQVLSTIQIQCKYTPVTTADLKKYAPVFVSFLRTLTDENRPVSTLILQYLAVILSNINGAKFKKAMILFGEGNTGKSKLIELVQFLLGEENYAVCDIADLEQRFRTSMLFQKRLTGSSDMSFAKISELKIFKNATGGDQLFAEKKGKDGFKFGYKGLFLFATNRLPNFGGDKGSWVYDRFIIVKCDNVIPKEKQDRQLIDKMKTEKDVIASYLVSLLPSIIKDDYQLQIPAECDLSLEEFRISNSPVLQFYEQFCEERSAFPAANDRITGAKIYNAFVDWIKDTNTSKYTPSYKEFVNEIASHIGVSKDDFFARNRDARYLRITVKKEHIHNGEINLNY